MSSTLLNMKRWDSTCTLARLATVSREWQIELERHNFARIKLTPSRLVDFSLMIYRNRALVRYIWLCLELDDYDCTKCAPVSSRTFNIDMEWEEAFTVSDTNNGPITTVFQNLFSVLSTWDPSRDLILDISIYSPSDSKRWFKYLTFMPDTPPDMLGGSGGSGIKQTILDKVYDDSERGWVAGFRHSAPATTAIYKVFHSVMEEGPFDSEQSELQWWDQLPPVPAVTSLLLRLQNRRRWNPRSLAHMFARSPRLQEVHYEPWRELDIMQTYRQGLIVFENFNQQYPVMMQRFLLGEDLSSCDSIRNPSPAISRATALASLKLEHLAASFIVDASHFFEMEPSWEWPNLTSLVITSKLLTPNENSIEIGSMLRKVAAAAIRMPQLETMEIWNGRKGLAALFKYHAFRDIRRAIITWRGTWELTIEPCTIQAWEAVVNQYGGWKLDLVQERLDKSAIKSHGDAIYYLMLSTQVIRPISLQQIQIEQKALEDMKTV
ncbi:hypothetical protein O1611_g6700 [Lasiodiplodia mahajangana]|uniref:Uncharacterized protein n=1 Tax=Lasiodiplodia mahajangana TaxID=1108764 RepID=A0ACC2JHV0_9PEZI|nr:hypothetical protein O1611_g6700 [Lasiodiplodia mahajangana]